MGYYRRIRDLREDSDLTQQQVADYLNMKQPQYNRRRKGRASAERPGYCPEQKQQRNLVQR